MDGGDVRYKRGGGVGDKHVYGFDGLYRHPDQHHKGKDKTCNDILGVLYCAFFEPCGDRIFKQYRILQNEGKYNPDCELFFHLYNEVGYKFIPKGKFREVGNFINGNPDRKIKKRRWK